MNTFPIRILYFCPYCCSIIVRNFLFGLYTFFGWLCFGFVEPLWFPVLVFWTIIIVRLLLFVVSPTVYSAVLYVSILFITFILNISTTFPTVFYCALQTVCYWPQLIWLLISNGLCFASIIHLTITCTELLSMCIPGLWLCTCSVLPIESTHAYYFLICWWSVLWLCSLLSRFVAGVWVILCF